MSTVIQMALSFETITCFKCQMAFAVPSASKRRWRESGDEFWCPNGHGQHYVETEIQRLQKQLDQERKRREWAESAKESAYQSLEDERKRVAALKGVVTRTKNRIANGVCPCCKRSFQNLKRHIQHQHPDYTDNPQPHPRGSQVRS